MIPLVIGAGERAKIQEVVTYAKEHIIPLETMREIDSGNKLAVFPPEHSCFIPAAYSCTFTIEEHPMITGESEVGAVRCRHLTIFVDAPGRVAAVDTLSTLMHLFGFTPESMGQVLEDERLWFEPVGPQNAVLHVLQSCPDPDGNPPNSI